jgi:gluconate 2-dehydrogenase gamma chain
MDSDQRSQEMHFSRRRLLLGAAGGSVLAMQSPWLMAAAQSAAQAHSEARPFTQLDAVSAAGLETVAARIIPTDETPGAREAGVIHFIDQALATFLTPSKTLLLEGLADLDAKAASVSGAATFATLAALEQDALLTQIEDSAFFQLVHYLTVAGMFAMPSYGGNREQLGWQLLGFEQRHVWSPPFGYYDAQVAAPMSIAPAVDQGGHAHD